MPDNPLTTDLSDQDSPAEDQIQKIRVFWFQLNAEDYCVDIREIKEVIAIPEITRVPNVPDFIEGVFNLRGDVIALLDVRKFFGLAGQPITQQSMAVVTDLAGDLVSFLVDKVMTILEFTEDEMQPPLNTIASSANQCVKGQIEYNDKILTLFDLKKVLTSDQIKQLEQEDH